MEANQSKLELTGYVYDDLTADQLYEEHIDYPNGEQELTFNLSAPIFRRPINEGKKVKITIEMVDEDSPSHDSIVSPQYEFTQDMQTLRNRMQSLTFTLNNLKRKFYGDAGVNGNRDEMLNCEPYASLSDLPNITNQ